MAIFQKQPLRIWFGDQSQSIAIEHLYGPQRDAQAWQGPLSYGAQQLACSSLFFAHQVHGIQGLEVTAQVVATQPLFSYQADFLLTNQTGIGIGVLTADCIPIILHDLRRGALALVHAGWRGSVAGVGVTAVERMRELYGTHPTDLQVIFGPAAGACCYEVGQEVITKITDYPWGQQCLQARAGSTHADMVLFNILCLQNQGVMHNAFDTNFYQCTICTARFCSHRRQGTSARRQLTVAVLS